MRLEPALGSEGIKMMSSDGVEVVSSPILTLTSIDVELHMKWICPVASASLEIAQDMFLLAFPGTVKDVSEKKAISSREESIVIDTLAVELYSLDIVKITLLKLPGSTVEIISSIGETDIVADTDGNKNSNSTNARMKLRMCFPIPVQL
jgi:hypothetical protein